MVDKRTDPHGPVQVPDRQPRPDSTDLANQSGLRHGSASRWLVPSAVLAAVVTLLCVWAMRLQLALPIVGIVWVIVAWIMMLVAARSSTDAPLRNRRLAIAMGIMAVGALGVFVAIYLVQTVAGPGL